MCFVTALLVHGSKTGCLMLLLKIRGNRRKALRRGPLRILRLHGSKMGVVMVMVRVIGVAREALVGLRIHGGDINGVEPLLKIPGLPMQAARRILFRLLPLRRSKMIGSWFVVATQMLALEVARWFRRTFEGHTA